MNKLRSRPPEKKVQEMEDFVSGAETKTTQTPRRKKAAKRPWEEAGVREDVIKPYNLRLSEPYLLKLKYIAEHTPDSMQKFCLAILQKEIDKKIEELTK